MREALERVRAHPIITAFTVACIGLGIAAAVVYLPAEWSLARRVAAGVLSGAGCSLLIVAPRVVGQ